MLTTLPWFDYDSWALAVLSRGVVGKLCYWEWDIHASDVVYETFCSTCFASVRVSLSAAAVQPCFAETRREKMNTRLISRLM